VRLAVLSTALVAGLASACGSSPDAEPVAHGPSERLRAESARGIPLGPTPALVRTFCTETEAAIPVLCPAEYPRVRGSRTSDGRDLTLPGYGGYLVTFNDTAFRTEDAAHVFLGGQPGEFSLRGRPGQRWPRPGEDKPDREMRIPAGYRSGRIPGDGNVPTRLRARVVGSGRVAGSQALLLRVPYEYPEGGVHSEHTILLWNQGGHGYLVSVHFSGGRGRYRYTQADRDKAALAVAASATAGG
jgi:hypothetical protein